MERPKFVLVGSTASGKKTVGVQLAERMGAEIISLDAIKIYRGMEVGTAKPAPADRLRVPFHLLDRLDPRESFSVGQFLTLAAEAVRDIHGRGKAVLFLGGTAFYLNALLNGLIEGVGGDPEIRRRLLGDAERDGPQALHRLLVREDPPTAEKIHPNDTKRIVRALEVIRMTSRPLSWLKAHQTRRFIPGPFIVAGLSRSMENLRERIAERTERMIRAGLVDEVKAIRDGGGFGPESGRAIGYRQILAYLDGQITLDEALERINQATSRYSRKQMTWYRRFPQIRWFTLSEKQDAGAVIGEIGGYFSGGMGDPS